jgi:AcrR family transcriptional regulator
MAEAAEAAGVPKVSRLDRRKARTRQALIDAAVRLIAEGRGDRASIAEITEEADIGFGSFYNHFDSKEQLFQTASEEVLERWGQMIDRATAGITDPAALFAVGTRISGRLGWTHPDIAGFLTGMGLGALDIPGGLAPRALRDRPPAGSPCPIRRSRSARWPAACSGCCGCASGTPSASRRPPSTSSPRPNCACSASPPTRRPAWSPFPCRTPGPGDRRDDTASPCSREPR